MMFTTGSEGLARRFIAIGVRTTKKWGRLRPPPSQATPGLMTAAMRLCVCTVLCHVGCEVVGPLPRFDVRCFWWPTSGDGCSAPRHALSPPRHRCRLTSDFLSTATSKHITSKSAQSGVELRTSTHAL